MLGVVVRENNMGSIHIVCPECGVHFQGDQDLLHRSVQCSDCEHIFTVTDASINKLSARQFPGERAQNLEAFKKTSPASALATEVNFETAHYAESMPSHTVLSMTPKRILMSAVGLLWLLSVTALFTLSDRESGILALVNNEQRWVLSLFSSALGGVLVLYGFQRYFVVRIVCVFVMLGVAVLPFFYPYQPVERIVLEEINASIEEDVEAKALIQYKRDLGYFIVQESIHASSEPERVLAVALVGVNVTEVETIKQYLAEAFKTSEIPRAFSNREIAGQPATLLIFLQPAVSFEAAQASLAHLGTVEKSLPELQLIECTVTAQGLGASNLDALSDPSHIHYFHTNLAELKNLNNARKMQAVQRLETVKTFMLKADIAEQLTKMLQNEKQENKEQIVRALSRWKSPEDHSEEVVQRLAREVMQQGKQLPRSYVEFCAQHAASTSADILVAAWKKEPLLYETILISAGKPVEKQLTQGLSEYHSLLLGSAVSILKRIGSKDSIPLLKQTSKSVSPSLKQALEATITAIQNRE